MPAWLSVPEAFIATWGGGHGLLHLSDIVHHRVCVPWRRRRTPAPEASDVAALLRDFRSVHAPRSAMAAAIITQDRILRWHAGRHRNRDVDADTAFEIGSITKTFTAALLADMAFRGEVALDMPVGDLLPMALRPALERPRRLTLADLACHSGGLPRLPGTPRMLAGALLHPRNPYAWLAPDESVRWLQRRRLSTVGVDHAYSNLGSGLLGAVLARRLDTDLEQALRARLLKPLDMHGTAVASRMPRNRVAQPHTAAGIPTPVWSMPGLEGSGALASTLNDMIRWMQAHLHNTAPIHAEVLCPNRPSDARQRMGLGWYLRHARHGYLAWHNGGTGGSRSFLALDRLLGCGVVILVNRAVDMDRLGWALLRSASIA